MPYPQFTLKELELFQWMLATAVENNPNDGEIAVLAEKVDGIVSARTGK
jgi:hypothetical protein